MRQTTKVADSLDCDKIKANLKTGRIGKKIIVYDRTSSTNSIAAEYVKDKKSDGLVIFAEEQSSGRGRAGHKWTTGRADSILCSIILTKTMMNAELLSVTCAVAVADCLGRNAKIKWPNDIIFNGKKIAGILLESKRSGSGCAYIIGIGINCHQKQSSFSGELKPIATSIDIENGAFCDRISLAKRLLTSMEYWLEIAEKSEKEITGKWRELSIQLGHRVTVIFNGKKFTGNCIGIDPQKGLILQLDTGGVRMFEASHTTIAK